MRQILSDEKILKKSILNLSKNTFGNFYDCLKHTLESSDMFFQLANKLKNIVNAIISINLEVDSSEAFQIIVRETCKVLECDRASVFLVNPNTNELWTKSAKGSGVIKVDFGQGLVGFVANTMKSLNILEAHKDCRFNPEIDRRNNYNTKSVLCVPVIDPEKGTLVGVMQAINKKEGFFTKDDEGCLQILAMHAMNVLKNSITYDEKQKNQIMIQSLLKISIKLSKHNTLEEVVPRTLSMICSYLDISEARFFLFDKANKNFFTFSDTGERIEYDMNCGLIGYALMNQKDEYIVNAYNHTNFNKVVDINTSMPLSIHILWNNSKKKEQILGALEVINIQGICGVNTKNQQRQIFKTDSHIRMFCEVISSKIKKFFPYNKMSLTPKDNPQLN